MPIAPNDESFIFGGVFMLANRMQALGDSVTKPLSTKQWFILLVLRDLPPGSSIAAIAGDAGSSRQNVKKLLGQLEAKGYVKMEPSEQDRRSTSVYMTGKAKAYMLRMSAEGGAFVKEMFSGVPREEIKAGRALVERLVHRLDEMKEDKG